MTTMPKELIPFRDCVDRRTFMSTMARTVGSGFFLALPFSGFANLRTENQSWTVGQIMDLFTREVAGAPFENTVDTLKAGERQMQVSGIVTTMFATVEVIEKAIALKANFIIAHEPTFYNHLDDTSWLQHDEVYQYKAALLKKHNIAVWRNHDYIHRLATDGVRAGVVSRLKWNEYYDERNPAVFEMPPISLKDLIGQVKERLGIVTVRYIGNLSSSCKKVLLMPGASGGRNQIAAIGQHKPDVILCGEIAEWETAEYVRDATAKGQRLSLVVLGHVASEEPGSEFLASWCKEKIKGVTTTHVPAGHSLAFL
jgi:putative NIF3 family GTP cyclohydrolase 1 type 2